MGRAGVGWGGGGEQTLWGKGKQTEIARDKVDIYNLGQVENISLSVLF